MNTTNTNRFASVLARQKRSLALDTLFAFFVAVCLLISIAGLSTEANAVPAFEKTTTEVTTADITMADSRAHCLSANGWVC